MDMERWSLGVYANFFGLIYVVSVCVCVSASKSWFVFYGLDSKAVLSPA